MIPILVNHDYSNPFQNDAELNKLLVNGILKLEPSFIDDGKGKIELVEVSIVPNTDYKGK